MPQESVQKYVSIIFLIKIRKRLQVRQLFYFYLSIYVCSCLVLSYTPPSNRWFPSCLSPLFQSESWCKVFHMEISFIHTHILVHLHVDKTNFHMKGSALGLAKGNSEMGYSPLAQQQQNWNPFWKNLVIRKL